MAEIIRLDAQQIIDRFRFLGQALVPTVYNAMLVSANRMLRDVVQKRMSGPRGAPGILGVVTGTARRSMIDLVELQKETISAIIGSPLSYVKAHELGYHGPQNVRAHMRRRLGAAKAISIAPATRGQIVKRGAITRAQRAKGPIMVKAHTRKVNIVAKHFIRDTIFAAKLPTETRIVNALLIAAKTGKVPTAAQIGA